MSLLDRYVGGKGAAITATFSTASASAYKLYVGEVGQTPTSSNDYMNDGGEIVRLHSLGKMSSSIDASIA